MLYLTHISDKCLYGDYRGLFPVGQRQLTCSQLGTEAKHKCYEENVAADCCETCPKIQEPVQGSVVYMSINH